MHSFDLFSYFSRVSTHVKRHTLRATVALHHGRTAELMSDIRLREIDIRVWYARSRRVSCKTYTRHWVIFLWDPLFPISRTRAKRPTSALVLSHTIVCTRLFLRRHTSDGNSMLSGHIFALWLRARTFAPGCVGVTTSKDTLFTFII